MLALVAEYPALAAPITGKLPDIQAQIVYAIEQEMAVTFEDILRRRTTIALQDGYGLTALGVLAQVAQDYCGWSREDCDRQITAYHQFMHQNCIPSFEREPLTV